MKYLFTAIGLITMQSVIGQHNYPKAQHLSTYFLGAQRCGANDSWIHGDCHLQDGDKVGKDLTGGWHDCGDYIKFHHTGPFAALTYLYGYDNFPESYVDDYSSANSAPPSNGIPDILDEVKIETDYLIKCVSNGTAYWQISNTKDHNSFSEPVTQSGESTNNGGGSREVYSTTGGHTNALANASSALTLMSIHYQSFNPSYATACLNAALEYYTIATNTLEATDDPDDFYGGTYGLASKDYSDELGLACALLYRVTNDNSYLVQAENHAASFSDIWDDFYYGNVHPLLISELYQLTSKNSYLTTLATKVNGYSLSSCGYYHSTNWGSLPFAGNAAFIASLYFKHSGNQAAYDFAKSNVDFILGTHGNISTDAPANFSFLIGYNELGGGYPQHPHHAAAFGKTSNAWTHFTNESNNPGSVSFAYELKGGLAGGPESECSNFNDNIGNYISSEYCTYYAAGFLGALSSVNRIENDLVTNITEVENKLIISYTSSAVVIDNRSEQAIQVFSINGKLIEKFSPKHKIIIRKENYPEGIYIIKNEETGEARKIKL